MGVLPADVAENLPELWTVANLITRMDPRIVLNFLIALSPSTVSPPKKIGYLQPHDCRHTLPVEASTYPGHAYQHQQITTE